MSRNRCGYVRMTFSIEASVVLHTDEKGYLVARHSTVSTRLPMKIREAICDTMRTPPPPKYTRSKSKQIPGTTFPKRKQRQANTNTKATRTENVWVKFFVYTTRSGHAAYRRPLSLPLPRPVPDLWLSNSSPLPQASYSYAFPLP